jgi:hypothetical protein
VIIELRFSPDQTRHINHLAPDGVLAKDRPMSPYPGQELHLLVPTGLPTPGRSVEPEVLGALQRIDTQLGPDDPRPARQASRRSPCLEGCRTHETIPRPPVRFLALYAHLPADGRWEGPGTPPARLKATPISLADASRVPGPGQGLRISVGNPPRPFDPSVSPSTVRTIRGTSGRVGAARRPRRPGWADAGAEARGDPTTPES